MGDLIVGIYNRTRRSSWLWLVLLVILSCASIWSASRVHFSEDLFDALPQEVALERYRTLLKDPQNSGRIIVGFKGDENSSIDSLAARADGFVERLKEVGPALMDSAFFRPDPSQVQAAISEILMHLPLYADSAKLASVAQMDKSAMDAALGTIRLNMARPGAELDMDRLAMDPLGLAAPLLERLLSVNEVGGMQLIDGMLFSKDSTMAVVVVMPSELAMANKERFMRAINKAIANDPSEPISGAAFGVIPMAVANAQRIGIDARNTSLVALVLIIGLLVWRYRSTRAPLLFFLPPVVGFLIGLGAIAQMRPIVSALSIGASAALLGIALDYGFHLFTHLQHTRNVRKTLKDVSAPMLLGCATTALAFAALSFVGSRVLADLGIIAAFMLIGAALTTLLVVPHFVVVAEQDPRSISVQREPKKGGVRWRLFAIAAITALLLPFVDKVSYDNDPEHLSFIPEPMREVRNTVEGDTGRAVPVFWTGSGSDRTEATAVLERSIERVRSDPGTAYLAESVMPTDLWPSDQKAEERIVQWREVFKGGEEFQLRFRNAAIKNGFVPHAFDPFLMQLGLATVERPSDVVGAISGLVIAQGNNEVTVAGRLFVDPADIGKLEQRTGSMTGVGFLHRGMLSERIEELVSSDLSKILWRTSLIVIIILLITYGRIELALLTFFPMALGWLWILGICGLLGIEFDLVNILVCTFVFGLGDDYCIFTTEGLLALYRNGVDHTRSFRQAVVLSGITTVIGTGVLLFAEHPALRSIAALSVTGMIVLLVISLTVQPVLFRLFIADRAAKGKQPFTLLSFLISLFAFTYFLFGCVLIALIWAILLIVPAPKRMRQHWLRHVIRLFTGSLVYVMVNTRKDIQSYVPAIKDRPAIIIANHASFIDILAMLMFTPNVVMMTNRWVWNSPFFGRAVRFAGYLRTEDGVEANTEHVRNAIEQGLSVIIFPEGTRTKDGRIGRFHKGAFHIAEALQVPIVPVILHGFGEAMSKNDALLKNALLTIRTLPIIEPGDTRFGSGDRERTKKIAIWYKQEYEELRGKLETPARFHERLMRNFMYKGPVLEWHTRVKARMDVELHELMHARIRHDARVVDLGSGHGMVSMLLSWSGAQRVVHGFERDADKVAVANNAFSRNANTTFTVADLEGMDPPEADAFILKDVLHYLPPTAQGELLKACARKLTPDGAIYVRDGFTSNDDRHKRTERSERYSVGLGFNQAKGKLHFMSKESLTEFARAAGMSVEWALQSKRTSNELAILKKVV